MKAKLLLTIPLVFSIAAGPIVGNADAPEPIQNNSSISDAGQTTTPAPTNSDSTQNDQPVSSDGQTTPTTTTPPVPTQEQPSEVPSSTDLDSPVVPTQTGNTQEPDSQTMTKEEYTQEILEEQFQQKMIYELESFNKFSSNIPSTTEETTKKDAKLELVIKNKEVRETCNVLLSTLKYDKKTGKLKCVKIKKSLNIKDIQKNNARQFFIKSFEEDSNRKLDKCEVFETRDVKKVPKGGYTVDGIVVCGYEQPKLLSAYVSNDGEVTLR